MRNIGMIGLMYTGLVQSCMPKTKPQRIVGYYNPETDKPQGRNEPCKCRSGKKFKHCCINKPKEK